MVGHSLFTLCSISIIPHNYFGKKIYQQESLEKNFCCEKRNASTPLGIEPRTFRFPVECSIIWATEVPQNFSHRIYLRFILFKSFISEFRNIFKRFLHAFVKITYTHVFNVETWNLELSYMTWREKECNWEKSHGKT